jgi:hypothetical protein
MTHPAWLPRRWFYRGLKDFLEANPRIICATGASMMSRPAPPSNIPWRYPPSHAFHRIASTTSHLFLITAATHSLAT